MKIIEEVEKEHFKPVTVTFEKEWELLLITKLLGGTCEMDANTLTGDSFASAHAMYWQFRHKMEDEKYCATPHILSIKVSGHD